MTFGKNNFTAKNFYLWSWKLHKFELYVIYLSVYVCV